MMAKEGGFHVCIKAHGSLVVSNYPRFPLDFRFDSMVLAS